MSEPKYVDFRPQWMRDTSPADKILDECPATGLPAEVAPRINARLVPHGDSNKMSAKTLSEAISLTQALVQYAGSDVCQGVNPDFADLRSLSTEVINLSTLTIEPFEEGSFVIPGRLDANPIWIESSKKVRAEDVVNRFGEILSLLHQKSSAFQVSIGAIQVVESLGRVIRREAEAIEFSSFDSLGQPGKSQIVNETFIDQVHSVRESRRSTQEKLDILQGLVTALDIKQCKLQLSMNNQRRRVTGHFDTLFLPSLLESLGKSVKLHGAVDWRGKSAISIRVFHAEILADK